MDICLIKWWEILSCLHILINTSAGKPHIIRRQHPLKRLRIIKKQPVYLNGYLLHANAGLL